MIKRARPAKILSGDAEIKSVLSKVHIAEINVAGQHQYASGQCNSAALLLPDKNLDSLARLVTGEETCAAVCHTKDRLLVSSNKSEPRYAKQYFQILKQYLEGAFAASYALLKIKALEQVHNIMVEKRSHGLEDQIIKARSENDLLFVKLATIVVNGCVDAIQEQGKLIVEDRSSSTRARSLAVDLVRPIIDTNIFLQALESRDKLNSEVIRYIKAGAIKYLSGSDQKHAEMKIYEELGGGVYYIGITKLACWPCNTVLEISNSHKDELEVKYSGTHGGTYPGWEAPQWILENQVIKQEFLTKLQENLGRFYKGKELYPYEEYFIPAPPMLAEFNSIEHARTQLTIIEQEKSFLLDKVGNIDVEVGKEESIIDALTQDIEERQNKLTETNEKIQRLESNVKQAQGNVESAQSERYGINNIVIELESICATTDSAQIKWDACRKLLNAKDKNLFGKLRPELQKLGQDSDKLDKVKNTMALMETEVSQRLKAAEDDYNSIQLELQECKESLENLNNEKEQLNFRKNAPEEFKITLCKNKDDVNEEVVLIKEKYQLLAYCIECYNELYSINNNDTELSGESTNIAEIS